MILNGNTVEIPECWYNDPNIQDNNGKTMAMQIFDKCEDIDKLDIP